MPRRTQLYQKIPWNGGINTAMDAGIIDDNDLVTADNVVFSISGARLKREGFDYFDSNIPTPNSRSSSGTTRTLYWTTNDIVAASPFDAKLVVGEKITITTTATSGNEFTYYQVTNGTILSVDTTPGIKKSPIPLVVPYRKQDQ